MQPLHSENRSGEQTSLGFPKLNYWKASPCVATLPFVTKLNAKCSGTFRCLKLKDRARDQGRSGRVPTGQALTEKLCRPHGSGPARAGLASGARRSRSVHAWCLARVQPEESVLLGPSFVYFCRFSTQFEQEGGPGSKGLGCLVSRNVSLDVSC